jgi:hypothetical protein
MHRLDVPVAAGGGSDELGGAAALEAAAGDAQGGDRGAELAVVRVADGPLDQERLGGVREQVLGGRENLLTSLSAASTTHRCLSIRE